MAGILETLFPGSRPKAPVGDVPEPSGLKTKALPTRSNAYKATPLVNPNPSAKSFVTTPAPAMAPRPPVGRTVALKAEAVDTSPAKKPAAPRKSAAPATSTPPKARDLGKATAQLYTYRRAKEDKNQYDR